ncbi:cytidylate kinase [Bacteroidia bacterium]|nr:cytidylate kinase [Bacteroidia bacterium]
MKTDIIIAIDGHSSSGKSSFAKAIAARLGYTYIDTGAMYRAVTLHALRQGWIDAQGNISKEILLQALPNINIHLQYNAAAQKSEVWLNGENVEGEIRGLQVSSNVSRISEIAEVRQHLATQQQKMGEHKAIVMDGRDIGTVVFPEAELKIFLTASAAVRARRRYDELVVRGDEVDYAAIERNICERDYIDEHRAVAPLRVAGDAHLLDNSQMTPQQQMEWVMALVEKVTN